MIDRVLVLGATGVLGKPVVQHLLLSGHEVCVVSRDRNRAAAVLGPDVDILEGSATNREVVDRAMESCQAVHISLSQHVELQAARLVAELGKRHELKRISCVSATTAREENRWFDLIDVKLQSERLVRESGIPWVIFCPTWVMEILPRFASHARPVIITGNRPYCTPFHFFAGKDFGRMAAASFDDGRVVKKRLFIHGPEAINLQQALERYFAAFHPDEPVLRVKPWQAKLFARLSRNRRLLDQTRLLDYFQRVGESGDPGEANELLGTPRTTLDEWIRLRKAESV